MAFDRLCDRCGAAVVEKRSPEAQPPECRRSNLVWLRAALLNAISGADIVQQQIGKQIDTASIERRVRTGSCRQAGDVTCRATDRREESFACKRVVVHMAARHGRQKAHE